MLRILFKIFLWITQRLHLLRESDNNSNTVYIPAASLTPVCMCSCRRYHQSRRTNSVGEERFPSLTCDWRLGVFFSHKSELNFFFSITNRNMFIQTQPLPTELNINHLTCSCTVSSQEMLCWYVLSWRHCVTVTQWQLLKKHSEIRFVRRVRLRQHNTHPEPENHHTEKLSYVR